MTSHLHQKSLEEIARDPEKEIGLRDVVSVRLEVPVYKPAGFSSDQDYDAPIHKEKLIAQADLLFELKNGLYVIGEYKCNDTRLSRLKAQDQLIIATKGLASTPYQFNIAHMGYMWGEQGSRGVDELVEHNGHYSWFDWMRDSKRV